MSHRHVYKLLRETKTKFINISTSLILVGMSLGGALPTFITSTAHALPPNTVVVNGDTSSAENSLGWMFNRDQTTKTPYVFVKGNASTGTGSLYVEPISSTQASDKFVAEDFLLTPLSSLNSFSVDYKLGPSTPANQVYLNIYANYNGTPSNNFYQCRYEVVAGTGSTSTYSTLSFNPSSSYPVTTSSGAPACPSSPAAMGAGSTIRMIAVNLGDTSLGDAGNSAYFDNAVVNTTSGTTSYDFEPKAVVNDSTGYSYDQIQPAVAAASNGDTLEVGQNIAEGLVNINKNVTLEAAPSTSPVITATTDTPFAGSWFTIDDGNIVNINNLAFDGFGHSVFAGVLSHGITTINNANFSNIKYAAYYGFAVVGTGGHVGGGFGGDFATSNLTVKNSTFTNIGRVGVEVKGDSSTATIDGMTYTGKGNVDGLDYGVEFGSGATGTVTNSTVTNNTGVASDGSTSAAIIATTYYGPGTSFTATSNHLTGNYAGFDVGYDANDTTTAVAHNNDLSGNTDGVTTTLTTGQVDATNNWWGSATGPTDTISSDGSSLTSNPGGTGSTAVGAVKYSTWCTAADCSTNTNTPPAAPTSPVWKNHVGTTLGAYTNVNLVTPSWTAGGNADHYEYSYTSPTTSWSAPANIGNVTSIPDQAFGGSGNNGTQGEWQFRVRSVSAFGITSAWATSPVITYDRNAPNAPNNLSMKVTSSGVNIPNNSSTNKSGVTASWSSNNTDPVTYIYHYWKDFGSVWTAANPWPNPLSGTSYAGVFNQGEGVNHFCVIAVDLAGNQSLCSATFTVTYDATNPTTGITSAAQISKNILDFDGYVNDANFNYYYCWLTQKDSGTEIANTRGANCVTTWAKSLQKNGNPATTTDQGEGSSASPTNLGSFDITGLLSGDYTIHLIAVDLAGNKSSDATYDTTIDHTAPTAKIDPYNGTDTTPTITGTIDDPTATLTVSIDGGTAQAAKNNGNGTWSFTVPTALSTGSHTISVTATDTANNAYTTSATIVVQAPHANPNGLLNSQGNGNSDQAPGHQPTVTITPNNDGHVLGVSTTDANTPEVKGDSTTKPDVKGDNVVKFENSSSKNSSNFLGLGWWWLVILAIIIGFIWFLADRRSENDKA